MSNDVSQAVLQLIDTYLPPLLPGGMIYSPEASKVLHRAIIRDYVEDDFSMREHVDSPFTEAKGFQLHASYNDRDFRVPEMDMLQHLQTFDATALPRKPFKFWAAACVYPLPPHVGPKWVQDSNDQWMQEGECDFNKGNWSFAILYFDETPSMDWTPPVFEANDLPPSLYYAREAVWHEEERTGLRPIDDYMLNTQLPYDAQVYAERRRKGIPLTPFQERVMEAGGWPYPTEEAPSGGHRDTGATGGGASGDGDGVSGGVAVDEVAPQPAPEPAPDRAALIALNNLCGELIDKIGLEYCSEQPPASEHVKRWRRAQAALGAENGFPKMTAREAQSYADKGWARWVPVADAIRKNEERHG